MSEVVERGTTGAAGTVGVVGMVGAARAGAVYGAGDDSSWPVARP